MAREEKLLAKAEELLPELIETEVEPAPYSREPLASGGSLLLDFGDHQVGYITLDLGFVGSHPDAPVWLRLRFAERLCEFEEDVASYDGWISRGWIQSEELHVDVLPCKLELPRRYAFRYVLVEVLDVSGKFSLVVEGARCRAVSSADDEKLLPFAGETRDAELDRIACWTLHECMQTVFEDGPKRDRRLWMGDLRLEALANYRTYGNNDLVKACLYLFAGSTLEDGRVSACIFLEPQIEADDTVMFDYSLLFIATVRDYLAQTGDVQAARELYPCARRQWKLAQECFGENDLVCDSDVLGWCFVDWNLGLNKQASAQGVYLYCARALLELARELGEDADVAALETDLDRKATAAGLLFDAELGVFVSGEERQVSWASQIWMVLGGVAGAEVLDAVAALSDAEGMVTPYAYHHYVDALISVGRREQGLDVLRRYWGGMADLGADTFWELFDPENPDASPYGGTIVNSYCHAWSCAPAYFLRPAV